MAIAKAIVGPQGQMMGGSFRDETRKRIVKTDTLSHTAINQTKTIILPRTGLLSRLYLYFTATISVATPTGNFPSYPWSPFNLFSNIKLYTSKGVNLWNCSGIGTYYRNIFQGFKMVDVNPWSGHNANVVAASAGNGVVNALSGAVGTTNYAEGILCLQLPVDERDMRGLHPLQTDKITTSLDITTGSTTDIMGSSGGTVTYAITTYPFAEIFDIPDLSAGPQAQPDLSWVKYTQEFVRPINSTGDNYQDFLVAGPQYTFIGGIEENNTAQELIGNITNHRLAYGARSYDLYNETYQEHLARNRFEAGVYLPEGAFAYDFTRGAGIEGVFSERDVLDTRQLADLSHVFNVKTGTTLTNSQMRYVYEWMLPRVGPLEY